MKKRAVVFPYNEESGSLLRHHDLLTEYEVIAAVSPAGMGLTGKDAGHAYGGEALHLTVHSSIASLECDYDTVIIADPGIEIDMSEYILSEVIPAIQSQKSIVCLYKLNKQALYKLQEMCDSHGIPLIALLNGPNRKQKELSKLAETDDERLTDIQTPMLLVAGLFENTNKFDIQLCLRRYFLQQGYNVSQIGTRSYCELFGFHSFPEVMFSNIPEWQKIVFFNHLCKGIEMAEKPDLIIIGVPGGIMPYNKELTNRFGVLAYEIANAVTPDGVVMSILYEDVNELYLENICASAKYKLGFEIDCFNYSNHKLDLHSSKREQKKSFITLGTERVEHKKKSLAHMDIPVFNSLNSEDCIHMPKLLENKLAGYAETVIM